MSFDESQFFDLLRSWWHGDVPIGGVVMAIIMATLRMSYSGETWKATIVEALLCGALTLTAVSAMNYLGISKDVTVAIGGFIGFLGANKIKVIVNKLLSKKLK
ncbi:phage holin, lambda family [Acinetobacter boissieri]|uniref:Phage holin, lambda family n=1 Tax=Acinetobacter boissieri TaxID=1219383 RepID=A0A1G6KHQ7_9GAMM|nr:phage holin, lambda family [Acinetobacter boissieri]SDC30609.1 phage holin, lambda family [Acinetobacter boissieri]